MFSSLVYRFSVQALEFRVEDRVWATGHLLGERDLILG